jgi:hypothetical protein
MRFHKPWKPVAAKRPMLPTPAFMRPHSTQAPALANFQLSRANAAPVADEQIGRAKLVA